MYEGGQDHIYGVFTVFLAGKSPNIRSYTVYIYRSGQPLIYAKNNYTAKNSSKHTHLLVHPHACLHAAHVHSGGFGAAAGRLQSAGAAAWTNMCVNVLCICCVYVCTTHTLWAYLYRSCMCASLTCRGHS